MRLIDLTGQKFGKLVVLERAENDKYNHIKWKCKCECMNVCYVTTSNLKNGRTNSCGCLKKEGNHKTHRKSNTRLYKIWRNMKDRCYNPNNPNYRFYGLEGKTVCDEWLHDFQVFYDWAMAHGYRDDLTIDRIDGTKGYFPDNCRWATRADQVNNRRNNRIIEYKGKRQTAKQLAIELEMNYTTLCYRLNRGCDIVAKTKTP